MSAAELDLALPYIRLAAKAWGDPSAPPILALHGWLDNAASFDALAPLLPDRYLVAVDLPGHGRSAHRPPHAWYHYVDYLDEIRAIAAHFGWPRFDLLGHSLGGTLACVYAAAFPEQVGHLLLIEALGPLTTAPEQCVAQLRKGLEQRAVFADKSLRIHASVAVAIAARAKAGAMSVAAAERLVERGLKPLPGGYVWSSDARLTLASPLRFSEAQVLAMTAAVRAPTLLVLAQPETPHLPRSMVETRAAQMHDVEVVRLPGHHHLHLEDPQPVAAALRDFLRRKPVPPW